LCVLFLLFDHIDLIYHSIHVIKEISFFQDPFQPFSNAIDWENSVHYTPADGAGMFIVHWRYCRTCRDGTDNPVQVFFEANPSDEEKAEFQRLWPLMIKDMEECGEELVLLVYLSDLMQRLSFFN